MTDVHQSDTKKVESRKPPVQRNTIEISEIKEIIEKDNHKELKKLLEDNNLNVNAELAFGKGADRCLLTIACSLAAVESVKLLLDKGADIKRVPSKAGTTERPEFRLPFSYAWKSGSAELLQLLIERGMKIGDRLLFVGFDCLDNSDLNNDKRQEVAAFLIKFNANVAYKERGYTFLHHACAMGGVGNARTLLERGVDRDAISDAGYYFKGLDALGVTSKEGHIDIIQLLLEWGKEKPTLERVNAALIEAASAGRLEVVELLTECGTDRQSEALIEAMRYARSLPVAEYLLNHGADVNANLKGVSPLLALISRDYSTSLSFSSDKDLPVAQLLLARGADLKATSNGNDALGVASANGYLDVVKLLLEWDEEKPVVLERVNAALIQAAKYGHLELVKLLTEHGADSHSQALIEAMRIS